MFEDFKTEIKLFVIVALIAVVLSVAAILLLRGINPEIPLSTSLPQTCDSLEIPGYELGEYVGEIAGEKFEYPVDLDGDQKEEIVRAYNESTSDFARSKPIIVKIFSGTRDCPKEELSYVGSPAKDRNYDVTENEGGAGDVLVNFWGDGNNAVRIRGIQTAYGSGSVSQFHFFTFRERRYMRVDGPSLSEIDQHLFAGENGLGKKIIVARGIWASTEEEFECHFCAHRYRFEVHEWNGASYDKKEGGTTKAKYDFLETNIEQILEAEPDVLKVVTSSEASTTGWQTYRSDEFGFEVKYPGVNNNIKEFASWDTSSNEFRAIAQMNFQGCYIAFHGIPFGIEDENIKLEQKKDRVLIDEKQAERIYWIFPDQPSFAFLNMDYYKDPSYPYFLIYHSIQPECVPAIDQILSTFRFVE